MECTTVNKMEQINKFLSPVLRKTLLTNIHACNKWLYLFFWITVQEVERYHLAITGYQCYCWGNFAISSLENTTVLKTQYQNIQNTIVSPDCSLLVLMFNGVAKPKLLT